VSRNSVDEFEWSVERLDEDFDTVTNGYVIASLLMLYLFIGLPWNIVVLAIILKKRLYTQPTVMLMLNLAVSNFLVYIFVIPLNVITGITGEYIFGGSDRVRCNVCQTGVAIILFPLVSMHTLTFMAIDRFIYLKKPLTYKFLVTPRRMLVVIAGIWVLCVALSMPPLFGVGEIRFSHGVATCTLLFSGSTNIAPNFVYAMVLIVEGFVPFFFLCLMYIWILIITRKFLLENLRKMLAALGGPRSERAEVLKEYSRTQLHLVRIFGVIFTSNLLTLLPLAPLAIAVIVMQSGSVPVLGYSIVYLIFLSSTVVHPVLQACFMRDIRMTIRDPFARLCRKV
jgi:hypothetical protein